MALTHDPFNPTPRSADWAEGNRLADDPDKYFGDMVEYMGYCVGRVVDKLDELGLRENTLVIYYSDNGSPLPTTSMMGDPGAPWRQGRADRRRDESPASDQLAWKCPSWESCRRPRRLDRSLLNRSRCRRRPCACRPAG